MNLHWESAAPIEEEVTLGNEAYILREAGSGASAEHKDATFKAVKVNNQTQTSTFGGIADADLVLLSRCFFQVKTVPDKPGGKMQVPVTMNFIRSLPNRITEPLVDHLKEISGMKTADTKESLTKQRDEAIAKLAKLNGQVPEDGEDTAKNSLSGATQS